MFTGCDCSEAALVPLVSLYFTLSLLIFHYLTPVLLCLWTRSHICLLNFSACHLYPPPFLTPPRLPHFSASSSVSPHMPFPPFFFSPLFSLSPFLLVCSHPCLSFSPRHILLLNYMAETEPGVSLTNEVTEVQQTSLCWVTTRPLCLSLGLSLFHMHIQNKRFSQISLSTCFSLCCATLTSSDSSEESWKQSYLIIPQLNFNHKLLASPWLSN